MIYKETTITMTASKAFQKCEVSTKIEFEIEDNIEIAYEMARENCAAEAVKGLERLLELNSTIEGDIIPLQPQQPRKQFNEQPIPIDENHKPTQNQIDFCNKYSLRIPYTRAAASEMIRKEIERQKQQKTQNY